MKSFIAIAALAIAAMSAAPAFAGDKKGDNSRKFTAERVFDLEYADDPQISPDGRVIAYSRKSMDRQTDKIKGDLWTIDTASGAHRPLLDSDSSVSSARWSPKGDRLLYLAPGKSGLQLRVLYVDSGESFSLAQLPEAPSAPVWSPDGKTIAFSMLVAQDPPSFAKPPKKPDGAEWNKPVRVFEKMQIRFDGAGYLPYGTEHVFTIPAEGGTPRQVTKGDHDFGSPEWLDNGTLLVVGNDVDDAYLDPIESEIYKINLKDLSMNALTTRDGPDFAPAASPNGKRIAFLGYDDELKSHQETDLYVMNADGSGVQNLTRNFNRGVDAIAWRGGEIVGQVEVDGDIHLVSFGLGGGAKTLVRNVGGTSIGRPYAQGAFSVAANNGALAFTAGFKDRPAEVGYSRGGAPKIMTSLNADLLPYLDMATIEEIKVKSKFDQREIEAWIAKPAGFKADGTYPLILEIHGGPFAMYGPFFAAELQRYAAEGYVVVYVNPRGSTGYGEDFAQLIDRAYPGHDYDDLMSVVDAVVAKNYADPKRLFVTGGSGGGVLTAWIVGNTDRFAAAVSVKPVINWATMALTADIGAYVTRHWIRANPWEDREIYWKLSPLSLVGNVTTPTMLMVGEEDWRTPAWESEQFYGALKLRKIDTALVRVPQSPHYIASRPSQLIAKTDTIMGWFAKYDPASAKDEDGADAEE